MSQDKLSFSAYEHPCAEEAVQACYHRISHVGWPQEVQLQRMQSKNVRNLALSAAVALPPAFCVTE